MIPKVGTCVFLFITFILHKSLGGWASNGSLPANPKKVQEGLFSNEVNREDIVVTFGSTQSMREMAQKIETDYAGATKAARMHALHKAFMSYHSKCTEEALSYLNSNGYTYQKMWSSNVMIIWDADPRCVETLAGMRDVESINPNRVLSLIDPMENEEEMRRQAQSNQVTMPVSNAENTPPSSFRLGLSWALAIMRVREAWEYEGNGGLNNGQGIVVANIDTGVRADHEALRDNFRRVAGWADGYRISNAPVDDHGHGTHTIGSISGSRGIGVAPGAQWISCRGCRADGCSIAALMYCCNWMICPHDASQPEPNNFKNCVTAPDIVSNSWGFGRGDSTFERCALAFRAAGIIPIWAQGNDGPECGTANSPGDLPIVIGVGSTDKDDKIADTSSRGPTVNGMVKPDVSAPGVEITSAWQDNPNSYRSISGTSMAAPHVAGLVALILQRCKLDFNMILQILQTTARKQGLGPSDQVCGGTPPQNFPNNFYGQGRVDALAALKQVVKTCKFNAYGKGSTQAQANRRIDAKRYKGEANTGKRFQSAIIPVQTQRYYYYQFQ